MQWGFLDIEESYTAWATQPRVPILNKNLRAYAHVYQIQRPLAQSFSFSLMTSITAS